MSNELVTLQKQLPADLRAQLAAQIAADMGRLGAVGGKDTIRITQDKKFELPTGDLLDSLEVAIVDFVYRNEYYPVAFNRKQITPPSCFAISETAATLKPSERAPQPQGADCGTCQQNQFGSSQQGDGKACKNAVMMAVLPLNADADTPLWVIKTSPTAIKHFNSYVAKVARVAQVPVTAVATKLFFDPASTYASVRFDTIGVNPVFEATLSRRDEARHRLMQEPDVSGYEAPKSTK